MQDCVNGAFGRDANVAVEPSYEELADLARAPMRFLVLERNNQALNLRRKLIGVPNRPPGPIGERLNAMIFIAGEDFVARLARDTEVAADVGH